jgi:hypothetical protein
VQSENYTGRTKAILTSIGIVFIVCAIAIVAHHYSIHGYPWDYHDFMNHEIVWVSMLALGVEAIIVSTLVPKGTTVQSEFDSALPVADQINVITGKITFDYDDFEDFRADLYEPFGS